MVNAFKMIIMPLIIAAGGAAALIKWTFQNAGNFEVSMDAVGIYARATNTDNLYPNNFYTQTTYTYGTLEGRIIVASAYGTTIQRIGFGGTHDNNFAHASQYQGTVQLMTNSEGQYTNTAFSSPIAWTTEHTIIVEWALNSLKGYQDGTLKATQTTNIPTAPCPVALSAQIGDNKISVRNLKLLNGSDYYVLW